MYGNLGGSIKLIRPFLDYHSQSIITSDFPPLVGINASQSSEDIQSVPVIANDEEVALVPFRNPVSVSGEDEISAQSDPHLNSADELVRNIRLAPEEIDDITRQLSRNINMQYYSTTVRKFQLYTILLVQVAFLHQMVMHIII